jgi:hypothetical protein
MQSDQRVQSMKPEKTPNPLESSKNKTPKTSASMCWAKTGLQNGDFDEKMMIIKWGWVKTLVPSEPQNSW